MIALLHVTCILSINHSILNIIPGLQLTNGQMTFSQAPTINALGAGLILGDAISPNNDMQLLFLDSNALTIAEGQLAYKNLDRYNSDIQLCNSH